MLAGFLMLAYWVPHLTSSSQQPRDGRTGKLRLREFEGLALRVGGFPEPSLKPLHLRMWLSCLLISPLLRLDWGSWRLQE